MVRHDYKPRLIIIFFIFLILALCAAGRLFWIQIYKVDFFTGLAQQQHGSGITVSPPRALILDRHNIPLVVNEEVISAFILPHTFANSPAMDLFLKKDYPLVHQRMAKFPQRYFWWLERACKPPTLAALKKTGLTDIQFIGEANRYYPFKELGPIIGFTDIDNQGIAGLELAFNKQLKGNPATYHLEKDARSKQFYFQRSVANEGNDGCNIKLTIDKNIQTLCFDALTETITKFKARKGAALILDPFTGEILAMSSYAPGDNPESLEGNLTKTKNLAVTECFEPGSVMKIFAALAALEEGVVDFDEEMDGEGKATYIQGLRVENWKSCGVVPFHDGVKRSSNVILAKIGLRLGPKLYDHFTRLGFGKRTKLDFPGQRSGFINHPKNWSRFSVMVMTFGYEETITLLQLARAFGIIANGGHWVEPYLIYKDNAPDYRNNPQLYSEKTLEQAISIMERVGERYTVKGFKLKGKTGTARMVVGGQYSTKNHIYTFAGFVEKGDYRRIIAAFVQEPEKDNIWASDITAPLVRTIAEKLAIYEFCNGKLQQDG